MSLNTSDFGDWYLLREEFEKAKQKASKKKDLIKELFSDLEEPEREQRPFDIDQYFHDRLETTRKRVSQVQKEMETRLEISSKFTEEIDSQIGYAQLSLEKFSGKAVGYNTGVDVKRNHLERQLEKLRSERRAAELRTWEDLVRLRKELREARVEYRGAARLKRGTLQEG